VWTYSHAILDSSFAEVLKEVFATYEARSRGEAIQLETRTPYREHIVWLQNDIAARADAIRAFWRETLAGFETPTNLDAVQIPLAKAGAPAGHDTVRFRISLEVSDRIRQGCAERHVRPSTFVEAAWALILAAFSGEDDVVFGVTRACRRSSPIPAAQAVIGLFI